MASDDQDILRLLAAALAPAEVDPPAEGLTALQRAVAAQQHRPARRSAGWWQRRWVVGVTTVATVLGGSSAAFAAGAPMPTPVRALAHDIGLPVTPPGLYALHQYEDSLARTLAKPSPDRAATAHAAQVLLRQFQKLSAEDRRSAGQAPVHLLDRADHFLAAGTASDDTSEATGTDQPNGRGSSAGTTGLSPAGGDGQGSTGRPDDQASSSGQTSSTDRSGGPAGPGNASDHGGDQGTGSPTPGATNGSSHRSGSSVNSGSSGSHRSDGSIGSASSNHDGSTTSSTTSTTQADASGGSGSDGGSSGGSGGSGG